MVGMHEVGLALGESKGEGEGDRGTSGESITGPWSGCFTVDGLQDGMDVYVRGVKGDTWGDEVVHRGVIIRAGEDDGRCSKYKQIHVWKERIKRTEVAAVKRGKAKLRERRRRPRNKVGVGRGGGNGERSEKEEEC